MCKRVLGSSFSFPSASILLFLPGPLTSSCTFALLEHSVQLVRPWVSLLHMPEFGLYQAALACFVAVQLSSIVSPYFVFHRSRCDPALPVFELRSGESLCLDGLCHVISGILAGGSLVSAWYFVASLTRWYGLVVLLFLVGLLFCHTN